MPHWISVLSANNRIEQELMATGTPNARPGASWVDVTAQNIPFGTAGNGRWVNNALVPYQPTPSRTIAASEFIDRLTVAEDEAIETLANTRPKISAWLRRMTIRGAVNLDSAELIAVLAYLKAQGVPTLWPDNATADARIAAIRA